MYSTADIRIVLFDEEKIFVLQNLAQQDSRTNYIKVWVYIFKDSNRQFLGWNLPTEILKLALLEVQKHPHADYGLRDHF